MSPASPHFSPRSLSHWVVQHKMEHCPCLQPHRTSHHVLCLIGLYSTQWSTVHVSSLTTLLTTFFVSLGCTAHNGALSMSPASPHFSPPSLSHWVIQHTMEHCPCLQPHHTSHHLLYLIGLYSTQWSTAHVSSLTALLTTFFVSLGCTAHNGALPMSPASPHFSPPSLSHWVAQHTMEHCPCLQPHRTSHHLLCLIGLYSTQWSTVHVSSLTTLLTTFFVSLGCTAHNGALSMSPASPHFSPPSLSHWVIQHTMEHCPCLQPHHTSHHLLYLIGLYSTQWSTAHVSSLTALLTTFFVSLGCTAHNGALSMSPASPHFSSPSLSHWVVQHTMEHCPCLQPHHTSHHLLCLIGLCGTQWSTAHVSSLTTFFVSLGCTAHNGALPMSPASSHFSPRSLSHWVVQHTMEHCPCLQLHRTSLHVLYLIGLYSTQWSTAHVSSLTTLLTTFFVSLGCTAHNGALPMSPASPHFSPRSLSHWVVQHTMEHCPCLQPHRTSHHLLCLIGLYSTQWSTVHVSSLTTLLTTFFVSLGCTAHNGALPMSPASPHFSSPSLSHWVVQHTMEHCPCLQPHHTSHHLLYLIGLYSTQWSTAHVSSLTTVLTTFFISLGCTAHNGALPMSPASPHFSPPSLSHWVVQHTMEHCPCLQPHRTSHHLLCLIGLYSTQWSTVHVSSLTTLLITFFASLGCTAHNGALPMSPASPHFSPPSLSHWVVRHTMEHCPCLQPHHLLCLIGLYSTQWSTAHVSSLTTLLTTFFISLGYTAHNGALPMSPASPHFSPPSLSHWVVQHTMEHCPCLQPHRTSHHLLCLIGLYSTQWSTVHVSSLTTLLITFFVSLGCTAHNGALPMSPASPHFSPPSLSHWVVRHTMEHCPCLQPHHLLCLIGLYSTQWSTAHVSSYHTSHHVLCLIGLYSTQWSTAHVSSYTALLSMFFISLGCTAHNGALPMSPASPHFSPRSLSHWVVQHTMEHCPCLQPHRTSHHVLCLIGLYSTQWNTAHVSSLTTLLTTFFVSSGCAAHNGAMPMSPASPPSLSHWVVQHTMEHCPCLQPHHTSHHVLCLIGLYSTQWSTAHVSSLTTLLTTFFVSLGCTAHNGALPMSPATPHFSPRSLSHWVVQHTMEHCPCLQPHHTSHHVLCLIVCTAHNGALPMSPATPHFSPCSLSHWAVQHTMEHCPCLQPHHTSHHVLCLIGLYSTQWSTAHVSSLTALLTTFFVSLGYTAHNGALPMSPASPHFSPPSLSHWVVRHTMEHCPCLQPHHLLCLIGLYSTQWSTAHVSSLTTHLITFFVSLGCTAHNGALPMSPASSHFSPRSLSHWAVQHTMEHCPCLQPHHTSHHLLCLIGLCGTQWSTAHVSSLTTFFVSLGCTAHNGALPMSPASSHFSPRSLSHWVVQHTMEHCPCLQLHRTSLHVLYLIGLYSTQWSTAHVSSLTTLLTTFFVSLGCTAHNGALPMSPASPHFSPRSLSHWVVQHTMEHCPCLQPHHTSHHLLCLIGLCGTQWSTAHVSSLTTFFVSLGCTAHNGALPMSPASPHFSPPSLSHWVIQHTMEHCPCLQPHHTSHHLLYLIGLYSTQWSTAHVSSLTALLTTFFVSLGCTAHNGALSMSPASPHFSSPSLSHWVVQHTMEHCPCLQPHHTSHHLLCLIGLCGTQWSTAHVSSLTTFFVSLGCTAHNGALPMSPASSHFSPRSLSHWVVQHTMEHCPCLQLHRTSLHVLYLIGLYSTQWSTAHVSSLTTLLTTFFVSLGCTAHNGALPMSPASPHFSPRSLSHWVVQHTMEHCPCLQPHHTSHHLLCLIGLCGTQWSNAHVSSLTTFFVSLGCTAHNGALPMSPASPHFSPRSLSHWAVQHTMEHCPCLQPHHTSHHVLCLIGLYSTQWSTAHVSSYTALLTTFFVSLGCTAHNGALPMSPASSHFSPRSLSHCLYSTQWSTAHVSSYTALLSMFFISLGCTAHNGALPMSPASPHFSPRSLSHWVVQHTMEHCPCLQPHRTSHHVLCLIGLYSTQWSTAHVSSLTTLLTTFFVSLGCAAHNGALPMSPASPPSLSHWVVQHTMEHCPCLQPHHTSHHVLCLIGLYSTQWSTAHVSSLITLLTTFFVSLGCTAHNGALPMSPASPHFSPPSLSHWVVRHTMEHCPCLQPHHLLCLIGLYSTQWSTAHVSSLITLLTTFFVSLGCTAHNGALPMSPATPHFSPCSLSHWVVQHTMEHCPCLQPHHTSHHVLCLIGLYSTQWSTAHVSSLTALLTTFFVSLGCTAHNGALPMSPASPHFSPPSLSHWLVRHTMEHCPCLQPHHLLCLIGLYSTQWSTVHVSSLTTLLTTFFVSLGCTAHNGALPMSPASPHFSPRSLSHWVVQHTMEHCPCLQPHHTSLHVLCLTGLYSTQWSTAHVSSLTTLLTTFFVSLGCTAHNGALPMSQASPHFSPPSLSYWAAQNRMEHCPCLQPHHTSHHLLCLTGLHSTEWSTAHVSSLITLLTTFFVLLGCTAQNGALPMSPASSHFSPPSLSYWVVQHTMEHCPCLQPHHTSHHVLCLIGLYSTQWGTDHVTSLTTLLTTFFVSLGCTAHNGALPMSPASPHFSPRSLSHWVVQHTMEHCPCLQPHHTSLHVLCLTGLYSTQWSTAHVSSLTTLLSTFFISLGCTAHNGALPMSPASPHFSPRSLSHWVVQHTMEHCPCLQPHHTSLHVLCLTGLYSTQWSTAHVSSLTTLLSTFFISLGCTAHNGALPMSPASPHFSPRSLSHWVVQHTMEHCQCLQPHHTSHHLLCLIGLYSTKWSTAHVSSLTTLLTAFFVSLGCTAHNGALPMSPASPQFSQRSLSYWVVRHTMEHCQCLQPHHTSHHLLCLIGLYSTQWSTAHVSSLTTLLTTFFVSLGCIAHNGALPISPASPHFSPPSLFHWVA